MFILSIRGCDLAETFETLEAAKDRFLGLEGTMVESHVFTIEHPTEVDEQGYQILVDGIDLAKNAEELADLSSINVGRVFFPVGNC